MGLCYYAGTLPSIGDIADAAVWSIASATIHEAVQYHIQVHILAIVSQLLDDALDLQGKADEACPWCSELRNSSVSSRPLNETGCTLSATFFLVTTHSDVPVMLAGRAACTFPSDTEQKAAAPHSLSLAMVVPCQACHRRQRAESLTDLMAAEAHVDHIVNDLLQRDGACLHLPSATLQAAPRS